MTNQKLDILSPSGSLIRQHVLSPSCSRKFSLMNEDSVTLRFQSREALKFPIGSSVGNFFITEKQEGKWNASDGVWDYELKFDAYYWAWKNKILRYIIQGIDSAKETSFLLTATIDLHAQVILNCLNALGITYGDSPFRVDTTDTSLSSEAKLVRYENLSILGGIQAIAEAFDCEWWVSENAIYFGRCENKDSQHVFEAGINTSSITFQQAKTEAPNRLYVYGSDRNLPTNYRQVDGNDTIGGVVVRRLMLPQGTPYLQTREDIPEVEIVEQVVVLDSVYPRTDLTVSEEPETYSSTTEDEDGNDVSETYYRLKYDPTFFFSESYVLPNEELHIVFQSGMLNGMEFGAKFNPKGLNEKNTDSSWNPDAQMIEVVVNEDYGRRLPDEYLRPKKGDKFILSGWDATKMEDLGLIADAEQELLEEGQKALEEYTKDLSSCTCPMAWDYMKPLFATGTQPKAGDVVTIIDTAHFGDGGRKSRIIGFEYKIDKPYAEFIYTCGENVSVKRLDSIEKKIEGLAKTGTKVQIQNSLNFLSKRYSDRTPYMLSSDVGFDVGDFLAGVSGARIAKDKETGRTYGELDELYVRVRAYFESLAVVEREALAGEQQVTPGGGVKCVKVEEVFASDKPAVLTGWRCYFLSEQDGEKRETFIKAGDQVISQEWNAKEGTANKVSNRRWWRLVTAVNQDALTDDVGNHYGYIEVSKADCEVNSDIPEAGDDMVQFGNRTDATRQTAIVISTVSADAPSMKLFTGIGSGTTNAEHYSLNDRDIISYGYDRANGRAYMRCYGDFYYGDKEGKTWIKYDAGEKMLEAKLKLHLESTIDGQTLEEYFQGLLPEDKPSYVEDALNQYSEIDGGLFITSFISAGYTDADGLRHDLAGMNGIRKTDKSPFLWGGGSMTDRFYEADGTQRQTPLASPSEYAKAMLRMDGSAYFAGGNVGFEADGSGWFGDKTSNQVITFGNGAMTFGSGIKIDLGSGGSTTFKGISDTLATVLNLVNDMSNALIPVKQDGTKTDWGADDFYAVKSVKGFYSEEWISARGINPNGGASSGGVSSLAMLDDVSLSNVASGQALVYSSAANNGNGGWVNQTIKQGLDESALATYLTTNGYALKSELVTASERALWNQTASNLSTILGSDASGVIDKWEEIVAFLDTYTEADTLAGLLSNKVSKAGDTMTGDLVFSAIGKGVRFGEDSFVSLTNTGAMRFGVDGAQQLELSATCLRPLSNMFLGIGPQRWVSVFSKQGDFSDKIKIGDCEISWDADNGGLRFSTGIYSEEWVSARGVNPNASGGGGGISQDDLDAMLGDYAKKTWVEGKGYVTSSALAGYALKSEIPSLAGYATEQWVNSKGYLTGADLTGYATQSWVESKGYLTGHQSLANYVTINTAQTISALKTHTAGLKVSGRVVGSGDDEGIVIGRAANNYAGLVLGEPSGIRSVFYLDPTNRAFWRFTDGVTALDILHPKKSGTIALTSDIPTKVSQLSNDSGYLTTHQSLANYLPLSGGTLTGQLNVNVNGTSFEIGGKNSSWVHLYSDKSCIFNKDLYVIGEIYAGANYNQKIWHSGNFNPSNYLYAFGNSDFDPATYDGYYAGMTTKSGLAGDWWHILSMNWGSTHTVRSKTWASQLALPTQTRRGLYYRTGASATAYNAWVKVWDESNDGSGSGLDADLLDGYHAGFTTDKLPVWRTLGHFSSVNNGITGSTSNYKNFLQRTTGSSAYGSYLPGPCYIGTLVPDSERLIIGKVYSNDAHTNGMPEHSYFLSLSHGGRMTAFGTSYGTYFETAIAFTTDNVASATKLQTARTIWGQSFDGTGNVSGDLTSVRDIKMNRYLFLRWDANTKGTYLNATTDGGLAISSHENYAWQNTNVTITYGGNVGIGSTNPTSKLYVNGTCTVTGNLNGAANIAAQGHVTASLGNIEATNGTVYGKVGVYSDGYVSARGQNTSDIRLKTDIKDFNASDIIRALRPVAFKWNALARSKFEIFRTDEVQYGLIAQEVKPVAPWLVDEDMFHDGLWGVHYERLIPIHNKAIKEVIFTVDDLLVRVKNLENENKELKNKIAQLERR